MTPAGSRGHDARQQMLYLQTKNMECSGSGSSWANHGAADSHDEGDDVVDALDGLVLGRVEVRGLRDRDIGGHPGAKLRA